MHLSDLLVACALAGLVLAGTLGIFAEGQRVYTHGVARAASQQTARVGLSRLVRDLRHAGSGDGALPPIAVAEPSRIVIQHDDDGDGLATARGETVTWLLSRDVLRRNAGGGNQPIINGVRAFKLDYLDAEGRVTTNPADVRTVVIALTTAPEHPGAGGETETKLATEIALRNR